MRRAGVWIGTIGVAVAGALVAACSSDSFSAPDGGSDAATIDATPDATPSDAGTTCDPSTPFQTVTLVADLSTSNVPDYHPTFTADELHVFYARNTLAPALDAGYFIPEIWESSRPAADAGWAAPLRVAALNAQTGPAGATWDPSLSLDGLTVYFSANRVGTQNLDVFVATRASLSAEFGTPSVVQPLATPQEEASPWVVPGKSVYFARGPQGSAELYRAAFNGANIGTADPIAELNTAGDERYPVVSADELVMYFARRPVNGTTDIMLSRRSSTAEPWGVPSPVASVNMPTVDDWPGWLSPDLCVFYFSSTRSGSGDLFRAVRNK
jgi:hypothetical protein